MSSNTSQVLGKLVLFSALTRIPGTECLAEAAVKSVSRTHRETQKFVNPKRLSGFKAIKSELFRLCRSYGTKIEVLDAWGVPLEDADLLTKRLEAMKSRWEELEDVMIQEWDGWVAEWAEANPDYRDEIYRLAPKARAIEKKTKFVFASFRLTPEQIASGSLDGEFDALHEQAAHEIAYQIRETYPDIGETSWDIKTFRAASLHGLLETVARKAKGLGFLSPRLAEIPVVVEALLKDLPKTGTIDGLAAIGIRALLDQLASSRGILERGIHLPGLGNATLDLDVSDDDRDTTDVAPDSPVLMDVVVPVVDESLVVETASPETPVPSAEVEPVAEAPTLSPAVLDLLGPEIPVEVALPAAPAASSMNSVLDQIIVRRAVDFCLPEAKPVEPPVATQTESEEAPVLGFDW